MKLYLPALISIGLSACSAPSPSEKNDSEKIKTEATTDSSPPAPPHPLETSTEEVTIISCQTTPLMTIKIQNLGPFGDHGSIEGDYAIDSSGVIGGGTGIVSNNNDDYIFESGPLSSLRAKLTPMDKVEKNFLLVIKNGNYSCEKV